MLRMMFQEMFDFLAERGESVATKSEESMKEIALEYGYLFSSEDGVFSKFAMCCGEPFALMSTWANACPKCDTEYNGSGQRLAPRSEWGHETGEQFS